jgi:predicted transposase YbfD/YdcC
MLAKSEKEFIELFNTIEDPREDEKILYPLSEILFLAISGVLSCAESWREIIRYGRMNIDFLKTYFPYNNGIPSKSLLSRVMGAIDKKQMEQFLIEFAAWFYTIDSKEIIAVDGKKIKGSDIHLLHVLATKCGIVLAQIDINNKHNESTAIPDILERLNIAGAVVTADALNCQKAIAEKIIAKGADYFLSLKGNQGTLFSETKSYFEDKKKYDYAEDINKEHGRIEVRRCWSTDDIDWLKEGLNKLPKSSKAKAKSMLHDIWMADSKANAAKAIELFKANYNDKYPAAVTCLTKDQDEMLAFYNFPAIHWQHIENFSLHASKTPNCCKPCRSLYLHKLYGIFYQNAKSNQK